MLLDFLRKELRRRQKKNKSYSVRAFAKSLNVDASTLSKILAGSRKLSYSMAKKITKSLNIDDAVKNNLLLTYADTDKKFLVDDDFHVPDEALSAELMSKWEYYALLSYIEINGKNDPKKIAQALGTTESTVKAILENLLHLDLIKSEKNLLKATGKILTAPPNFNSASLKKVHKEYIEKAGSFLMEGDLTTADFSGITFAVSSKKVKEAAQRIRDFRRSLGQFLSEPGSTEDSVYRINIQFFPIVPPKT